MHKNIKYLIWSFSYTNFGTRSLLKIKNNMKNFTFPHFSETFHIFVKIWNFFWVESIYKSVEIIKCLCTSWIQSFIGFGVLYEHFSLCVVWTEKLLLNIPLNFLHIIKFAPPFKYASPKRQQLHSKLFYFFLFSFFFSFRWWFLCHLRVIRAPKKGGPLVVVRDVPTQLSDTLRHSRSRKSNIIYVSGK